MKNTYEWFVGHTFPISWASSRAIFCGFETPSRHSLFFLFATINIVSPVFTGVSGTKNPAP